MSTLSPLELAAHGVRAGTDTIERLMELFVGEMVFLPSSTDPASGVSPVLTNVGDSVCMVVGVSPPALRPVASMMRFVVTLTGRQALAGLGESHGVMVLLTDGAFEINADLAREARQKYGVESRNAG